MECRCMTIRIHVLMATLLDKYHRTRDTFLRKGFGSRPYVKGASQVEDGEGELRRVLGAFDLTMLGVGAIIGAGVFVLTGEAAKEFAGPSIILSYLFSSVAAILLAFSYVEFAVDMPLTGGAFNYINHVHGEFIAWQAGSCLILEYTLGCAAVSKGFSGYLGSLLGMGSSALVVDAWIFVLDIPAFCLVTISCLLLAFGTKESSLFNTVVACINLLVIFFVLGASVPHVEQDNYTPFIPNGLQDTFKAAAVVFFAYIGFDSLATVAAEVKNPTRDLPIGVVGSILISAVVYLLMAAAISGMQSYTDIDSSAPFSEAFVSLGLRWASRVVSLGALTGIVTSVLTNIIGQSRVYVALGRVQLLPPWIAVIDERRGTPKHAIFVEWMTSGVLALLFDIDILSRLVSMGTLFTLGVVSLASIQRTYFPKEPPASILPLAVSVRLLLLIVGSIVEGAAFALDSHPAIYGTAICFVSVVALSFYWLPVTYIPEHFVTPLKPITPCAAVLAATHFMFNLGWEAHVLFFSWQILVWIVYVFYGMYHSPEPAVDVGNGIQLQESVQGVQNSTLLNAIADRSDAPPPSSQL